MKDKARKLIEKYEELESELGNPDVLADQARYNKIHKQYKGIEKAVQKAREYLQTVNNLEECKLALGDSDPEMVAMAKEEISDIEKRLPALTDELQILMVPKDPWDYRNATLEIRGGTGGDESALFAGDLFRMYRGYCDKMGWKMTIQDASEGTVGGYKEIRVFIEGDSVYGTLKFESGVHRVQRVPETETQGRVHTSAATVAILPEAEEVDVEIREADIHMDTYRSSGAGGQYINKTDSAVRMTHLPTGIMASCQTERSQIQNRETCYKMLKTMVAEHYRLEEEAKRDARMAEKKKVEWGSQIRSYVLQPYQMVKDLRTGVETSDTAGVLDGKIKPFINAYLLSTSEKGDER